MMYYALVPPHYPLSTVYDSHIMHWYMHHPLQKVNLLAKVLPIVFISSTGKSFIVRKRETIIVCLENTTTDTSVNDLWAGGYFALQNRECQNRHMTLPEIIGSLAWEE